MSEDKTKLEEMDTPEHARDSPIFQSPHMEMDEEKQFEDASSKVNKNVSTSQNATNAHPLMYSPTSPISPDYPDLIPEKPKLKVAFSTPEKPWFHPDKHPYNVEDKTEAQDQYEIDLNIDLPTLEEYKPQLPEFPASPSQLRKSMMYDLPVSEISDTENENSVYEAHLSSNLQNVSLTMNDKEGNLNFLAPGRRSHKLRKIKVVPTEDNISDVSSIDSNTDSLKSEDIFMESNTIHNTEDTENERKSTDESPEPIEPLSAADERKHARHWQRMVLPGGEHRTIDMRVIEPYKRVLSHGGYLRAGGHTAIVIFSACFLPDKSRVDYDYVMDNLFLYVLWTLERLVTDDYVLVYLHGGTTRLPSFSWLKRCYQMVGRRLRKNLSHLYIVHPSLWIKTMLFMAKPFISGKFYRKITFVGTLRELLIRVPIEPASVPDKVKDFDSLHCRT